jgi:hypothetical protein
MINIELCGSKPSADRKTIFSSAVVGSLARGPGFYPARGFVKLAVDWNSKPLMA